MLLELVKLGYDIVLTPQLEFDLVTSSGLRIEVKTATPRKPSQSVRRLYWEWTNRKPTRSYAGNYGRIQWPNNLSRKRSCDYYALVGIDVNLSNPRFFILPKPVMESLPGTMWYPVNPLHEKSRSNQVAVIAVYENKWPNHVAE